MSTASVCNDQQHQDHWEMTPARTLLLLALTASLAGRVHCQELEDESTVDDVADEGQTEAPETERTQQPATTVDDLGEDEETIESSSGWQQGSEREFEPAEPTEEDSGDRTEMTLVESLSPTIIIIPLVLVLIIICMVVAGVMISRRLRSKASGSVSVQHDAYLDACEGEKVPMPMFEDDVPSVLELEMEDLEKWMVKDGGGSNLTSGPA
ncbi:transmembrane protein 154 [Clupea harengus]|uniref:Transmembrane protein 154 n=1 Tax=Clupea harengus TaxID=7950 RepID=A0A6P8EJA7_CLUHA|nr:transmembrane protein 154 [Clupea harengus]